MAKCKCKHRTLKGKGFFKKLGRRIKKTAIRTGKKALKFGKRTALKVAKKAGESKFIRGLEDKAKKVVNLDPVKKIRKKIDSGLKKIPGVKQGYKQVKKFAEEDLKDAYQGNGHCGSGVYRGHGHCGSGAFILRKHC